MHKKVLRKAQFLRTFSRKNETAIKFLHIFLIYILYIRSEKKATPKIEKKGGKKMKKSKSNNAKKSKPSKMRKTCSTCQHYRRECKYCFKKKMDIMYTSSGNKCSDYKAISKDEYERRRDYSKRRIRVWRWNFK